MRSVLYLFTVLIVMGLAFWAYRENYSTQAQINRMAAVQQEIGNLREELGILKAEWAYLNRPERLRELVNLNFEKLKLLPLTSGQFVDVGHVDYPIARPAEPDAEGAQSTEDTP